MAPHSTKLLLLPVVFLCLGVHSEDFI